MRTEPWLVQRVMVRTQVLPKDAGVDRFFAFDYMGSAEFEWGALPAAVRAMRAQQLPGAPRKVQGLWYVGPEKLCATATTFAKNQLGDKDFGLKEASRMKESLVDPKSRIIGWWCVDPGLEFCLFKTLEQANNWLEGLRSKS